MSAMMEGSGSGKGGSQDFELNLASIIDCFTVLIAFMLATASFLSIGILDAGIAAAGAESKEQDNPPPIQVTVELKSDRSFLVKTSGKAQQSRTLASTDGKERDFSALTAELSRLKQEWPAVSALTLSADASVEYTEVIRSMEASRKAIPVVLLGGF